MRLFILKIKDDLNNLLAEDVDNDNRTFEESVDTYNAFTNIILKAIETQKEERERERESKKRKSNNSRNTSSSQIFRNQQANPATSRRGICS